MRKGSRIFARILKRYNILFLNFLGGTVSKSQNRLSDFPGWGLVNLFLEIPPRSWRGLLTEPTGSDSRCRGTGKKNRPIVDPLKPYLTPRKPYLTGVSRRMSSEQGWGLGGWFWKTSSKKEGRGVVVVLGRCHSLGRPEREGEF